MLQPQVIHSLEQTAKFLFVPTNEDEYNQLVELLNEMIDIIRDNERHPLANLMDVLGVLSERFKVPASVFI